MLIFLTVLYFAEAQNLSCLSQKHAHVDGDDGRLDEDGTHQLPALG